MSLPATLDFSPKAGASHARTTTVTIKSNSTDTYASGSTIYFDIPVKAHSFLDQSQTYIAMNVSASAACDLDNSVYSCFKSLAIYHNSILLERIDNYGVLAGILLDYTTSVDAHLTSLQMLGCNDARTGFTFGTNSNTTVTLAFPLLSSLFSHCNKYIPIGALNNSLQIQLVVNDDKGIFFHASNSPTVTIRNPELHATYVELSQEAYSAIQRQNGGQFQFYGKSWKNNQFTVTPSAGNTYSLTVGTRVRSLTDYIICLRRSSDLSTYYAYSTTGRVMGGLSEVHVSMGNEVFPLSPIKCIESDTNPVATALPETLRSFNSLYNGDFCTCVNFDGYYNSTGASVTDNSKAGTAICINTEAYSGRNNVLMSGLNCMGSNSQVSLTFATNTIGTAVVDVFCEHDVLFNIDEFGQMNVTN